jgi:hypothetical protein
MPNQRSPGHAFANPLLHLPVVLVPRLSARLSACKNSRNTIPTSKYMAVTPYWLGFVISLLPVTLPHCSFSLV